MTIALSVLLATVSVCLIISVVRYKNIYERYVYQMYLESQYAEEIKRLSSRVERLQERNLELRENSSRLIKEGLPNGTMDAVRYAVKKSHPDNGGNAEDFIKFNEILKKLKERDVK